MIRAFLLPVSGERKLKLLYEMMEHMNYKGLISEVISPCILYVDEKGDRVERQKLLELILETMGILAEIIADGGESRRKQKNGCFLGWWKRTSISFLASSRRPQPLPV